MDALQLLGSLLGNNPTSSRNGNQILNQLVRGLTGGGSGLGGASTAGRGGGDMASLLGGLAMTALQAFAQRGTANAQSPLAALSGMLGGLGGAAPFATPDQPRREAGTLGPSPARVNEQALTLVQAMINAAKADGHIDEQERQNILGRLGNVGPQELQFVRQALTEPLNMDFLEAVEPGQAAEVYMVSLMAINLDTPAELQYMQQLAQRLGLDPQTVDSIHQNLGLTTFSV
jgi:uncharacterized membrane protein YebE (DUF533 family)